MGRETDFALSRRSELDVQSSGEQSVTVEDSMGVVHSSRGRNQPASEN